MRIRHSLKAFVPFILMLAAGRNVQAQYGPPGSEGMAPPGFGVYQPQSPYQNVFDQTYESDGMWFNRTIQGLDAQRDWFFNARYVQTRTRKLDGIFGADGVQTYTQQNDPAGDGLGGQQDLHFYGAFDPATADMIPKLKTHGIQIGGGFWNADGSGLLLNGSFTPEQTSTYDARARIEAMRMETYRALALVAGGGRVPLPGANAGGRTDLDIVKNDILAPGVVFDATDSISYGMYGTTFDVLDRTLMNLHGIPILHGTGDVRVTDEQNGTTVPYDLQFIMQHSIQTAGGSADWAFSPAYERGRLTVRPIFGGRYLQVDETFQFYGEGTRLTWGDLDADAPITTKVPAPADGIDDDDDFIIDNIDEQNGGTPGPGTSTTFIAPLGVNDLIVESFILSNVESSLAGPQFGFQYDLGDRDGLQLSGNTRFGLMLNREKIRLGGNNIFDFMGREVVPDPVTGANVFVRGFDTETDLNRFADTSSSTHLSPLFEQGINAQIPIFRGVPVLKDMWQLEEAHLTVGASFLWVGQVADPNQSVYYESSPFAGVFPTIEPDRMSFYQTSFNVGINWSF